MTGGRSFEVADAATFEAILPKVSGVLDEARPSLVQVASSDQRIVEQVLGAVHRLEWDAQLKMGEAAVKARDRMPQPNE